MGDRRRQLNMSHTLSADARLCDLNATSVADYALISDLLVLTAVALPVLAGPEDLLTEQPFLFGLQRSIVNGFRLGNFASGPLSDFFGRCQTDLDGIKCHRLIRFLS